MLEKPMNKKQIIDRVNTQFKGNLNTDNTCYANINKSKKRYGGRISLYPNLLMMFTCC